MFLVIHSTNMDRWKDISNASRTEIVNQKRNGVTNGRIYHLFDWSVRTVQNIWRRYRESKSETNDLDPAGKEPTTALEYRR